ncbi:uncharacterized protein LOC114872755 [Osmia bicornis bicornis]|uniref:uncharacterized protein LOC114872755 n=1 Tax=Osmia bicornis bicornis TaxID=1437191 RepID=UPI001EAF469A|nr:uncharacterized protein LOC114872755 [Osmia bicornis bicornis]
MGEKSETRGPSEMPTLRWTFKILAVLGYFPISYWPTLWQKILYNFYGIFLTICLYILETTQLLDLMFGVESQDEFSENLYITLVFFCDSCKTVALLRRCENIVDLIETVKKEPFAAMNAEEEEIQAKFMEQVEWNSIIYTLILDLFVLGMWIVSFLTDFPHGRLKYRAWIPYDYSSPWIFAITYIHQVVATTFATNLIIACDSMFSGLLVNIYCQIEVLEYRLKNVGKYPYYSVKLCARHHQRIYEFARAINEEFTAIISVQFMVNTISLCFNHYRLSQLEFGSKFIETAAYTFCLLTQIFYYCWYGNEVKLKSLMIADAAFESTLMSLDNNTRKMFLMIMIRAMEPIQFTSIHIVSMNLESFITLLKTSYSAYTVLQQTNSLLLHICCQFEILQHRFKTLDGQENYMVNQCASHHHQIYMSVYFFKYLSQMKLNLFVSHFSMSVLCLNLYQMTNSEKLSMCMKSVLYSICVFSQIFYYCFYGNVVTEKSTDFPDVIFGSDWPSWNDSSKKILLMVIRRSRVPVEFTSMHVVSLNLKSFMSKRMHKAPLPFYLLTLCGYWRPTKWPIHSFKYWLYNVYSIFMIAFIYVLAFYGCVDSAISKDLKTLAQKSSVGLSVLRVCIQVPIIFYQRENIISLLNILEKESCTPKDDQEAFIQQKYDKLARKLTIYCELLNQSAVFLTSVMQYHKLVRTRTFPSFDWLPYSVTSIEVYMISLLYQTFSLIVCATTSVAIETMFAGLMIQARVQFEIFCHRAQNVPIILMEVGKNNTSKRNLRKKWHEVRRNLVKYHQEIINFVHNLNITFQYIVLIQFLVSSTVLCLSIYQMSTLDLFSMDMVFSYSYLGSMLMEVYLYCWFGNEMTLKSNEVGDAIYQMDWTILPADILKDFLLIMTRSMKPVKISCGHIFILSVESFMSIIKLSYSSYNLMKNTEDTEETSTGFTNNHQ